VPLPGNKIPEDRLCFFSTIQLNRQMSPFPCDSEAEKSSCGVGFVASLKGEYSHDLVQQALQALQCVEHRGACNADRLTSDGAGIMLDIPFEMFGHEKGSVAIATLFAPRDAERWRVARKIFETTFNFFGAKILGYRKVPVDESVLGPKALQAKPRILHGIIKRPGHCRSDDSYNKLLYQAKQFTQAQLQERGIVREWFFTSFPPLPSFTKPSLRG
jgi:glutamate synthase domain-containing protein 1